MKETHDEDLAKLKKEYTEMSEKEVLENVEKLRSLEFQIEELNKNSAELTLEKQIIIGDKQKLETVKEESKIEAKKELKKEMVIDNISPLKNQSLMDKYRKIRNSRGF